MVLALNSRPKGVLDVLPALLSLMTPAAAVGLADSAALVDEVSEGGVAVAFKVSGVAPSGVAPSAGTGTERDDNGLSLSPSASAAAAAGVEISEVSPSARGVTGKEV